MMPDPSTSAETTVEPVEKVLDTTPEAVSLPADDGDNSVTMASTLSAIIQGKDPPEKAETPEVKAETEVPEVTGDKPEQTEGAKPEAKTDPDENLPFHKHPRWQEIHGENKTLREKVAEYEPLVAEAKQDREYVDAITGYLDHNGLSGNDLDKGLTIMALIKKDPAEAVKVLEPILRDLEVAAGVRLPEELDKRVDDGELSTEAAKELAKLRRESEARERQAKADGERKLATDHQASLQKVTSAVTALENQWKASDTDYKEIGGRVAEKYKLWLYECRAAGRPFPSAEEAMAKATELRDEVKKEVSRFTPQNRRPNTPPVPGRSSAQTGPTVPPKGLQGLLSSKIQEFGR